jgi:predicted membrane protein
LIGAAGWADLHPALFIGPALAAVIGGFVARAVRGSGSGRGLIPISLLMLTAVAVVAVASPYLDEGIGDKDAHPTTFTDVQTEYSYGIGSMVVDLRDVDFPAGVHHIDVDHGIGSAQVLLPADVSYEITGNTDIGNIDVLGQTEDGFNNEVVAASNTTSDTIVVIDFNVDIGYGRVGQE